MGSEPLVSTVHNGKGWPWPDRWMLILKDRLRYQGPDCGDEWGGGKVRRGLRGVGRMERTVRRSRHCHVREVTGTVDVPGRGGGGTELRVSGGGWCTGSW